MKDYVFLKIFLGLLLFLPKTNYAINPPVITATGNQTYCPGTSLKIVETISITNDPAEPDTDAIYVQISSGYVSGQDLLTYTGSNPSITSNWIASEGKLKLYTASGNKIPYADFETAIKEIKFSNSSTSPSGIRTFSINLGTGQLSYLPRNKHFYEYFPNLGITWTDAKAAAETKTYYGLQGYLATLTAADEAQLAGAQAPGAGWIGGSDAETEGVWKWVTGPEAGTTFWIGKNNGTTTAPYYYANWNAPNEPNNTTNSTTKPNGEDYAHITAPAVGNPGKWNDLANQGDPPGNYQPKGYIVEFGGMVAGDVDTILISASTTITIPKITSTTPSSRCDSGNLTLQATATDGIVCWYTNSTGGTPIATGNSFNTSIIFTTTTFYVDATNGNCPNGPRTPITATVNTSPSITSTTPTSRCDSGTATLGAVASAGTINWYNSPTGGTVLGTGNSFTTPNITSTTTYYVDATVSGCTTPTRTPIVATIYTFPSITSTTPASRCDSGTVTLGASASAGIINWYDVPTGGTILGTGNSFTTPNIASTTTYYIDATNSGCTTPTRTAIIATINTSPSITSTTPASRCNSGTVMLVAASSSGNISWYNTPTGGTALGTGNSFTTPSLASTTTYYVDATATGCTTPARTAIIATINISPTITSTAPASRCDSGSVTLGAVASAGTINWYDSQTGGTAMGTGTTFTTPSLASTTTYYIDASLSGCTTPTRTPITATINTPPTITSTAPASRCDSGSVTLGAVASAGTINWYDSQTGGTLLGTGTIFTTPSISSTTTYFVDASIAGCTTPARTAIIATINTPPTITSTAPASRCDSGSVTLGAVASTGTINWYDSQTGGTLLGTGTTFTTPSLASTTTYYIDASLSGCTTPTRTPITATINTPPTITSTAPESRCDSGSITLRAVASAGTINWHDSLTAGTLLGTGTTFTTPALTATTTYYVDATASGCTTPTRTAIIATINTPPSITSTAPANRCESGSVTLGAVASAGTINWYNSLTAGTLLGTGTTFTTPALTATTTYYVDTTASGCTTPTRTAIIATINTPPSITSTAPANRCESGSVTLGAVASAGTINWYNSLTAGTLLGTGTTYTTPTLTATTTYYVDATASGCTTPTRTAIIATINTPPSITSTAPANRCDSGSVTLEAVASAGTINWYDSQTRGTLLGTGTIFTTPSISSTTTYYVDATASGCTTATRTAVIAAINTPPTITSTAPASRCDSGIVTLGAVVSAGTINWYDSLTGGTLLGTGTTFTTPTLTSTTTYYVEATTTGCTSPKIAVEATIYPITSLNEEVILCKNATLDAAIPGMNYLWTPNGETTQTIIVTNIGDYSVTISSPLANCDSKKDFKVIEHPKPVIKVITVDENAITIELENPQNYYEFSIDGELFKGSNQFSRIPSGQHTAYVREKNGCNLLDQDFTIFTISKYFTPNNDGFNDLWEINEMKNFPNSRVEIFNRYGKLLKQLNYGNSGWNGTFNGLELPADDYWYVLKLEDSKPEIKGHFSLKR